LIENQWFGSGSGMDPDFIGSGFRQAKKEKSSNFMFEEISAGLEASHVC
jgi:hypothetical protein